MPVKLFLYYIALQVWQYVRYGQCAINLSDYIIIELL